MAVKTYQAYTMGEALDAAKRDLGTDATILETRSFKRGGIFGIGKKTIFELTATEADRAELSSANKIVRKNRVANHAAQKAYSKNKLSSKATDQQSKTIVVDADDQIRTRRLAQALAETHDRRNKLNTKVDNSSLVAAIAGETPGLSKLNSKVSAISLSPPHSKVISKGPPPLVIPLRKKEEQKQTQNEYVGSSSKVAKRFLLTLPGEELDRNLVIANDHSALLIADEDLKKTSTLSTNIASTKEFAEENTQAQSFGRAADHYPMQEELGAIKKMVGQVLQQQIQTPNNAIPSMPPKLFDMYLTLLGQEVSEEIAEQILKNVRAKLDLQQIENEVLVREAVLQQLAQYIPAANSAITTSSPDDRPLTIALIGPTGVGKTTTLAKLAASYKLRHGLRVGMVTCDTYRIAAVDQLRTYANIIGLPFEVALTPAQMKRAVHSLRDCDVILIDTAGRGQRDTSKLMELKSCLAAADPHEVHLVLSSTSSEKVLLQEAEAFSEVGADKILLTKLDEAVSFGILINVMLKVGKQLSFITTGQEVPDHIEAGSSERLAGLVLGGEVR